MESIIVGHSNGLHDPAIALIARGQIFAESLERHTQCKRSIGLFYSMRPLGRAMHRLFGDKRFDEVTIRQSWQYEVPSPHPLFTERCAAQLEQRVWTRREEAWLIATDEWSRTFTNQLRWMLSHGRNLPWPDPENDTLWIGPYARWLTRAAPAPTPNVQSLSHHLAHAANAVFTSPFSECVVMIADGSGEADALSFFHYDGSAFRQLSSTSLHHSLGILYGLITELCGFDVWSGEEWKIMGLAAYGQRRPELYDFFRTRTQLDGLSVHLSFESEWPAHLEQVAGPFRKPGEDPERAADIAHNFQEFFADIIVELARRAGELGLSENLAFAGGCALNSSANGRLLSGSPFRWLHVPSAPADDGNALGAALYEHHVIRGVPRSPATMSPYLGSEIEVGEVEHALERAGLSGIRVTRCSSAELCRRSASLLAAGKILGWVQGRAEFGPRALGNRSILADPRPAEMKDRINKRVKFREEYRPIAPAILHEYGPEFFSPYEESPYMERALPFRLEVRGRVPAVVHEDGTGRLQTVKREWNPLFHELLSEFHAQTGIPLLVNTSLNVMGKPIVHSATDALTVFYTTGIDAMAIGSLLIEKL